MSEGDSQFLHPYAVAEPELESILKRLEQLTSTKPEQVTRVEALSASVKKWIHYADQKVSAGRKSVARNQKIHDLDSEGKSMMDDLRLKISEIISVERVIFNQRANVFSNERRTLVFLIFGSSLLFAGFIGIHGRRQLKRLSATYSTALQAEVNQTNELKNERHIRELFVSTLSHDLRSPLTAIQMSAQFMLQYKKSTPEAQDKLINRILSSSQRANRMIEDLLDANRIKAGERLPLVIEPQDLVSIARDAIDDLSLINGERFVFNSSLTELRGFWSIDGLRRIFENLCNNAVKYGASDSKIFVGLGKFSNHVEFTVHNIGNPLSELEQVKLFEPFQRSESVQSSGQKGWGLGLTLVQGIAKAHGGTVRVQSSAGDGTTFTVCLPYDGRDNDGIDHCATCDFHGVDKLIS